MVRIFAVPLAAATVIALAMPAAAQAQRQRTATEVIVVNARQAALTEFELANGEGRIVGQLKAPLAPGKRVTIKLARGAPCAMTVSATFEDEFENAGAQINACRDKIVRFAD